MTWKSFEVAPGITRIESVLGPRPFSQYVLREERSLLVDTGVKETPRDVILPALAGLQPDYVLISHADVDHFGGNASLREALPMAMFCAHAADVPWIESRELIMLERYGWYETYGIGYPPETFAWLRDAMGPAVPVDLHLRGGEIFRLGPALSVEVLPLPGHSPGHVGLWEPRSRTAVVLDAVMGNGLLDTEGNVVHPPPIVDVPGYERSVQLLQSLDPERLLTAHYQVIEGDAVARFLEESLAFLNRARTLVAESPTCRSPSCLPRRTPGSAPSARCRTSSPPRCAACSTSLAGSRADNHAWCTREKTAAERSAGNHAGRGARLGERRHTRLERPNDRVGVVDAAAPGAPADRLEARPRAGCRRAGRGPARGRAAAAVCASTRLRRSAPHSSPPSPTRSTRAFEAFRSTTIRIRSPSRTRPIGPPASASGPTWPMHAPVETPENRASVITATCLPNDRCFRAEVIW